MSYDPRDDAAGEWIVYDEIGYPIGRYGQDETKARAVARLCGGRDKGVTAIYKEPAR
ncbi:hypothetical protein [Arthrobacter sp. SAFR-014]|uniref:hypothetical protein n=1 Tax=unclassified Arthrobacter TaxID=235627 RepID=UPI003F7BAFAF